MVNVDIPQETLDAETLRSAIAGEVADLSPSAAFSLLADIDISDVDPAALLREAAQNSELPSEVRIGAMGLYSRVAGADSVSVLADALGDSEDRVARAAALALGNVGTQDQLEALQRAHARGDGSLRDAAAFAEALIVHRLGLTDRPVDLARPELLAEPTAAGSLTFVSVRPGARRRDRALRALAAQLPWFDVAGHEVHELQCGRQLLEIAVDLEAARSGSRPAVSAVVAAQDPEYGEFHAHLIVLSRPSNGDRVEVRVSRLSGEQVYVGEGSVADGGTSLELRAAAVPGVAPAVVRVRLTADGVEISGVSSRRIALSHTPDPAPEE